MSGKPGKRIRGKANGANEAGPHRSIVLTDKGRAYLAWLAQAESLGLVSIDPISIADRVSKRQQKYKEYQREYYQRVRKAKRKERS